GGGVDRPAEGAAGRGGGDDGGGGGPGVEGTGHGRGDGRGGVGRVGSGGQPVPDPSLGQPGGGDAAQLDEIAAGGGGEVGGRPALPARRPAGVEDHRLTERQRGTGPLQQRGIGGGGQLRPVEALAEGGRRRPAVVEAGQVLAHLVGAQHRPAGGLGQGGGQRRLAGAGQAADEHQPDAGGLEVAGGEVEQAAGGVGRGGVAGLAVAQAGDLAADMGPGGDVVVGQRPGVRLAGQLPVVGQEPLGRLGVAQPFEVHGQEGHVGQHVDVAQPVVELDAVEDAGAVVEAEDVLGLEVAVAVAHRAGGDAVVEQRRPAGQVAAGEVLDMV